jgi:2'-5' RNA ligase
VVRAENLHLTLAFLGEVAIDRIALLDTIATALDVPAFDLTLDTSGYWRHNRVVWIGTVRCPAPLLDLAQRLAAALRAHGFRDEAREYAAHITLVREARRTPVSAAPAVSWPIADFVLVRSTPGVRASNYEIVKRFALRTRR